MTGSVSQKGDVQPIGGLNQKIEGFHDVCKAVGFSGRAGNRDAGTQPAQPDAAQRRGGVRAQRKLSHLRRRDCRQAVELLTGVEAGQRREDGSYPEGSINARVDARLKEMGEAMRQFGRRGTPRRVTAGTDSKTTKRNPIPHQKRKDQQREDAS